MTSPTDQSDFGSRQDSSQKLWAIFCHISPFLGVGFILPLVVYLVMRNDSRYVAGNAAAALNFHISCFIYMIVCFALTFILIGIPLMIVVAIGSIILSVIAAIKSSEGEIFEYPLTIPFVR